jgi:hypothetical protein
MALFTRLRERISDMPPWAGRTARILGILIVLVVVLYYPIGMLIVHRIDDDPNFAPPAAETPEGSSHAVAMAAALIDREVDQNRWVANDPFFLPGAALDNMPHFQLGMIASLGRFAFELTDQIGRSRGSSAADRDLQEAAGLLQYSGTKWIFDPTTSLMPTASSEQQYRKASRSLTAYNMRVSRGEALFDRRADNLQATLDRIASDIGNLSAQIDSQIRENQGAWFDFHADDVFYQVKGQVYAYQMIIKALMVDFQPVLQERNVAYQFDQLIQSLNECSQLDPWVVVNGRPDSQFTPSHLAAQGFFLLRARTQLREITNILQK